MVIILYTPSILIKPLACPFQPPSNSVSERKSKRQRPLLGSTEAGSAEAATE